MENFVFPDKCSFMLIAMTKSLNNSTVDQKTLQSLWGCLGDNHWAQSVLRSLSMDRQIKAYQIFHIWDSRLGPKASFMKGVERGILNIANYSIVGCTEGYKELLLKPDFCLILYDLWVSWVDCSSSNKSFKGVLITKLRDLHT